MEHLRIISIMSTFQMDTSRLLTRKFCRQVNLLCRESLSSFVR